MTRRPISRRFAGYSVLLYGMLSSCAEPPTRPTESSAQDVRLDLNVNQESSDSTIPGAYIVLLRAPAGNAAAAAEQLLSGSGAQASRAWDHAVRGFSVRGLTPDRAAQLEKHPLVKLVEPDRVGRIAESRALSYEGGSYQFSHQWGLDRIDKFGAYAYDGQFNYSLTGSGVHIYIVDTGVRGGHQQFAGRIGTSSCHIFWSIGCSPTIDAHGHGTRMAGLAAGATYGVATGAIIHSVRISEDGGVDCSDAVDGLDWIRAHAQYPAVASLSWNHYPGCFSVRDAIDALVTANILVFKAAGNDNRDALDDRGNRSPGAVIVGGTDQFDARAAFLAPAASNWGSTVTLMAPAINLRTANSSSNTDSVLATGTSVAAPLAAGAAAAVLEGNGTLGANELKAFLLSYASPVSITNGNGVANRVLFSHLVPPTPPPPGIIATIIGSNLVRPNVADCFFSVSVSGGTGSYSYSWTRNSTPIGGNSPDVYVATPGSGFFTLAVFVSDGVNSSGSDQVTVTVSQDADEWSCSVF